MHVTVTPATSTLPLQVNVRLSRSEICSIAAAEVMSLKMEPGVNVELMHRLRYVPSAIAALSSAGSVVGEEVMQRISPVL